MTYLVSACLLGCPCRYDGRSKPIRTEIAALLARHTLIPVCPECFGGLPTPRPPAERLGERVINCEGRDVTEEYRRGARETLRLARLYRADGVILCDKSPSCGTSGIYDGSFTRTLCDGVGLCAELLIREGITVFGACGPSGAR